ncbi:hypothetical protein [Sinomicrobium sp. M5D2P17]
MKSKKKICIYPMRNTENLESKSPYVYHLCEGLHPYFDIVNYGVNDLANFRKFFKYFFKSDIYLFNWIENLSSKKQVFLVAFFVFIGKIFGKKIIWTHHNVHPHKQVSSASNSIMKMMVKYADLIITHTTESEKYLRNRLKPMFNFFHPFFVNEMIDDKNDEEVQYDLLIWGTYRASKGINKFLDFFVGGDYPYKVCVVGRFDTEDLYESYKMKYGERITMYNMYLEEEDLMKFHKSSRYVFFPYTGSSVLNSGALIRTIPYGTPVIGPDVGAFKELADLDYILSYKDFESISSILEMGVLPTKQDEINDLISKHTWSEFGKQLYERVRNW